ncbi:MAG TPA: hypothetical protein DDW65_23925 [Firmicutes bacterium]|nr:hypothetical protein [Bacillota bacterium]
MLWLITGNQTLTKNLCPRSLLSDNDFKLSIEQQKNPFRSPEKYKKFRLDYPIFFLFCSIKIFLLQSSNSFRLCCSEY